MKGERERERRKPGVGMDVIIKFFTMEAKRSEAYIYITHWSFYMN